MAVDLAGGPKRYLNKRNQTKFRKRDPRSSQSSRTRQSETELLEAFVLRLMGNDGV
jgi:hypothetical protein